MGFQRVLVLCAHPDDEFGCGGTIVRLIEEGATVFYAAFSKCEESLPPGYPSDALQNEMLESTRSLGISPDNVQLFNFPVRHFPAVRQEILEELVKMAREIRPDLVLMPSRLDIHQDHTALVEEGLRAFKLTSVFSYELPWNSLSFENTCFFRLEERHVDRKVQALKAYKSQSNRNYSRAEFTWSLALVRMR